MLTKIQIIEINSNHLIAEYPLVILEDCSRDFYFIDAWENAVKEGLVDQYNRLNYDIAIL